MLNASTDDHEPDWKSAALYSAASHVDVWVAGWASDQVIQKKQLIMRRAGKYVFMALNVTIRLSSFGKANKHAEVNLAMQIINYYLLLT